MSVPPACILAFIASECPNSIQNLYGKSTTTDILLKSDLQARMLRNRLTPSLNDYVAGSLEEIEYAMTKNMPVDQGTVA